MKKIFTAGSFLFVLCLCLAATASAQSQRIIHLKDGSVLRGELIKLQNGIYTVKTKNLGTFQLNEAKISGITDASPSRPTRNASPSSAQQTLQGLMSGGNTRPDGKAHDPQQLQALQQNLNSTLNNMPPEAQAMQGKLLSDPKLMQDIQSLAQDPEIRSLMTDPALMQAIMSGDLNALGTNSNAQKLLDNPKMQKIINKLHSSQ